jgi:predicted 3-demethylubiquinone-9 3-methyltransferase (glyoxalase superfamily)
MHKITPHLWFDKEAKAAADLYTSIFKDSRIRSTTTLHHTPSGTVDLLTIQLLGQEFRLINAGSFQVHSRCIVSHGLQHEK